MSDTDREFWNQAYMEDPAHAMVPDHILVPELEGLPVGTALDLGCGSGANVLELAARGWSVVGVDWSERAIGLARQAAQEQGLVATFIVGDTTCWAPPRAFDLVVCTYALPGGPESQLTLRTAAEALVQGGTLLVAEWDRSMSQVWHFAEGELASPDQIATMLPGLVVDRAEVRCVANVFPPNDPRAYGGPSANVAFVRAHKP